MLKFKKSKEESPADGAPADLSAPPAVPRRLEDRGGASDSLIAPRTAFQGGIRGAEGIRIGGSVKGDVQSDGLIRVLETGRIEGDLRGPYIIIEGELIGDIRGATQVELRTPARVHGNIETERLAIAEGSLFEGRILMSSLEGDPVRFEEKREPVHKRKASS